MSLPSRYAGDTIARSIAVAMKLPGGKRPISIRPPPLARYGWIHIHCQRIQIKLSLKVRLPFPPLAATRAAFPMQCRPTWAHRQDGDWCAGNAEDYKAFEGAIIADYDAQPAVERELVLRLANLLSRRLRRATTETGLFEIQADHLKEFRQARQALPASRDIVHALFGRADSVSYDCDPVSRGITNAIMCPAPARDLLNTTDLARCFFRLANLPNFALDRLSSNPLAPSWPDPVCARCWASRKTVGALECACEWKRGQPNANAGVAANAAPNSDAFGLPDFIGGALSGREPTDNAFIEAFNSRFGAEI
jgi:hypothetical protein